GTTIEFTIATDGAGKIRAAGTWGTDAHPVDEPLRALLTATPLDGAAGRQRIGPRLMADVPGQLGVVELPQVLPPGRWKVVVESITPALGRGESTLDAGTVSRGFPPDFPPLPRGGLPGYVFLPILGAVSACTAVLVRRWWRGRRTFAPSAFRRG
ncbi:MAG TPA: hypothetical protein VM677_13920, partial [Actinokineospora sp.]|nr:hypothetical protein [Actinokineospora sp.]